MILPSYDRTNRQSAALLRYSASRINKGIIDSSDLDKKSIFKKIWEENWESNNSKPTEPDPNEWGIFEEPLLPMGNSEQPQVTQEKAETWTTSSYQEIPLPTKMENQGEDQSQEVFHENEKVEDESEVTTAADIETPEETIEDQVTARVQNSERGTGGLAGFMSRIFKS